MRPEKLTQTVGLFLNATNACPGYTLMSPMQGNNTYLLNNAGQYVHKWTSQYCPGRADYLMTNGHLLPRMFRAFNALPPAAAKAVAWRNATGKAISSGPSS